MSVQTANNTLITQERISAESLLNSIAGVFDIIMFVYDLQHNLLRYNHAQLLSQLGYEEDEDESGIIGFTSLLWDNDEKVLNDVIDHFRNGEEPEAFHIRLISNTGEPVTYNVRPRRKEYDHCIVFVASREEYSASGFDEIAELRRINSETESMLQFGTFEYDVKTDTGKWSEGLYEIFGYTSDRPPVRLAAFLAHLTGEHAQDLHSKLSNTNATHHEYNVEYNIITRDGYAKQVQIVGRRLYNADRELIREIGIVRDITQKKLQEEHLKRAIDELQRSNKELEEFAYVASHDLQEPLRKISTFSGRLAEKFNGTLQGEGQLYVSRIIASAENMRILIDNLLEFSRISRIRQPFVPIKLDFVLHQVKSELELTIEETGTQIISARLPMIDASLSLMKQLFGNIISNAIKFRKEDHTPEIVITSAALSQREKVNYKLNPDNVYHRIRICDNGIGFEDEYAARIFQIFQRLHGRSEYPGSGIGLAICKKITDLHKGIIFAENIKGKGACFTIILPDKQR